jgi:hypothetical protein
MTHTGIRKTTRFLASAAFAALTVAGSLAFAGPRAEWLSPGGVDGSAASRQSLHVTPVAATEGLTTVSAELRTTPRGDQATSLRGSGSIRADIARYNEERSLPRPPGRPSDDARSPANANYRN